MIEPPETHTDLLERPLLAHYATVRPDGAPQVNPMWFLWDPERSVLRMTHTRTRHNFQYVQREPRVALSIVDPERPLRYLQVRGVVESIEDDPTGSFHETLQRRYRGTVGDVPEREQRVILVIRPTAFKRQ